ncbi:MAG: hypothetical protein K2J72_03460, partial [Oscillospiraceae bacterium]|nr:hypothetical protein [Oscillospiraceae bacterium]
GMFIMPAGGFFTLGVLIAVVNKIANKKPPQQVGCANCPNAANCPSYKNEDTANAKAKEVPAE